MTVLFAETAICHIIGACQSEGKVTVQNEVQKEASQYEIPAHRLQMTFEGKRVGEGKSLGEAVVVKTLFGKAKVRIVHEQDNFVWLWPAAILALLGALAAIWWWQGTPETSRPDRDVALPPALSAAAPTGQVPENIPELINPVEPPTVVKETAKLQSPAAAPHTAKKAEAKKAPAKKMPVADMPATKPKARPKNKPAAAINDEQPAQQVKQEQPAETPVAIKPSATPTALQPSIQITRNPADQPAADGAKTAPPADSTQQPAAQP
jgi:hypothetical protein